MNKIVVVVKIKIIIVFRCIGTKKRLDPTSKAEATLKLRMQCSSGGGRPDVAEHDN